MRKFFLLVTLAIWLSPTTARAGIYILPADADTYLEEAAPDETHGSDATLINKLKSLDNFQSAFRFDLTSVPADETVLTAIAVFYVTQNNNEPVGIHRITDAWTEAGASWNSLGISFDPVARYGAFIPSPVGRVAVDITPLVRQWTQGVQPNYGIMIVSMANDKEIRFASRESLLPNQQPQLVVTTAEAPTMRVASGSYLGNGAAMRPIAGLKFRPDLVLIKGNENTATVARTSTMFGDASKELGPGSALLADNIVSLDADGFTVGSGVPVNQAGVLYFWTAFQAAPGEMAVGSYLGNGTDDHNVLGTGFEPDYLIVMAESGQKAMQRYAAEIGDASQEFEKADPRADRIQAFLPDGFQVGTHNTVNDNKVRYHYVAWTASTGTIAHGSYNGNGNDNRNIIGLGFQPQFVFLTAESNVHEPVERMESMTGDLSFRVNTGTVLGDLIQSFGSDGFQVGAGVGVNANTEKYYWTAFRDHVIVDADLALAVAVDDSLPNENEFITFTLTLSNNGPAGATGAEVTALLPAGLTYVTHLVTQGSYDQAAGVWAAGDLFDGGVAGLVITASVDAGTAGSTLALNSKITAAGQPDPDESNNSDSTAVRIRGADVAVEKTVDVATPNEGDAVAYEIVLTNAGPDSAYSVEVMDLLPAGVTYVSDTPTQGVYSDATGRWSAGSIAVGDTARLVIEVTVDPGTGGETIRNIAALVDVHPSDIAAANDSASADIQVQSANLAVAKTVNDATPAEADAITFTIELTNAGPDDATGVEVTDFVPAGLTYTGHNASRGDYDAPGGIWNVGTVAVTETVTLTIDATVDPGTAGWTISNLAAVTGIDQADPDAADNSDFAKFTVQSSDFRMTTGTYSGNGALTRSIAGIGFQPDVVILQGDDGAPATVKSASMPGAASKELAWGNPMYTNVLTSLDADGFTVSPDGWFNSPGNNYFWIAFKTATGNMVVGSYVGDGSDGRAITGLGFSPGYLMILPEWYNQASQRFPAQVGDASVTFGYGNEAPDRIQSFLPDGFEIGADSLVNAPGLTYHYIAWNRISGVTAGNLHLGTALDNWNITGIDMQPEYVLMKRRDAASGAVHHPASLAGDLTLNVRDGFTYADGIQAFLPDGFQVGVDPTVNASAALYDWFAFRSPAATVADLDLAMTVIDTVPIENDTLTYTVTLTNMGPDGASGVRVIDLLPAGLSYVSDVASQGIYAQATGLWDVGVVLAGDSATLEVFASVEPGTVDQTIVNDATVVAANQADPDTTNNSAFAPVTVGPSRMRVVSGAYTGDGGDNRSITGLGFRPDMVIVKGNTAEGAVVKTSTMIGDASKTIGNRSAINPNMIQSLDADGFTVGASTRVNESGVTYYWTAFRSARPEMVVGSYMGDGSDDRSIGGVGFAPAYLMVLSEAAEDAMQRFASQSGDASLPFTSSEPQSDRIQRFEPDGFQVGTNGSVNGAGSAIHFVAWNDVPGRAETGLYLGDGVQGRELHVTSLRPNFVLVQRSESGSAGVFRNTRVAGDLSLPVGFAAGISDAIQAILPDGFQIGAGDAVNYGGDTYYWSAFKDSRTLDVAVSKDVSDPTPNVGDVVEYTITVSNDEAQEATGLQVLDLLPAGLVYDSDAPLAGTYNNTTGVWDIDSLPGGAGTALVLRARVDAGTAGTTIVNTASLWGVDQIDVGPENDGDKAAVTVNSADLAVAVSVDDFFPTEGDTITYVIHLSNAGPVDAAQVVVADSLPVGVTWLADSTSHGAYSATTGVWSVGTVAAGDADTLWIVATIDAGTMGLRLTNFAFAADSVVADPDQSNNVDSVTVLVPTAVTLKDAPASLFPSRAFVGDPDLALRIGVDNEWDVGVALDTTSSITFTDGIRIYRAELANATYVPPGANDFYLSFQPNTVPPAIVADSTYDVVLSLRGTTDESRLYEETISTAGTNSLFIDQPKMSVDAPLIGDRTANPGQLDAPILVLRFDNHYSSARTLDSLIVTNAAVGPGSPAQLDALSSVVAVYHDVDGDLSMSNPDTLLAGTAFVSGRAAFAMNPGWTIPALSTGSIIVTADVDSTAARDGDRLNAWVTSDAHIAFAEATIFDGEISPLYPLDSYGTVTIDGMVSHQISLESAPYDSLFSGSSDALVSALVVPQNGYQSDTLLSLNVADFSGSFDPADFDRLSLFLDDGDGAFDAFSDTEVGEMVYSGDRYEITGIAGPTGAIYFVAADISVDPGNGNSFRPGVPVDGIAVDSGNDGPLDAPVVADKTYTIVKVEKIDVVSLPLQPLPPRPGDRDVTLLRLQVTNNTLSTVTLDTLVLANATAGPGAQTDLDGELSAVHVYSDDGNGEVDAWDPIVAGGLIFTGGALTAAGLGQSLDPAETAQYLVACDVDSTCARDSDDLRVRIVSAGDVRFQTPVRVEGAFPLQTDAAREVNGMMSFQIGLYPSADSTVIDETADILVLDLEIPANGYAPDTLTSILVENLGTAGDEHIRAVKLWADGGNDTFDKGGGDDVLIHSLVAVGGRQYQRSGLGWPLTRACTAGTRVFVSCDLTTDYTTGASIQFSLPGGPLGGAGIGVASGNDGPIDGPVTDPTSRLIPSPDELTIWGYAVGDKRVYPGSEKVLNFGVGLYNGFSNAVTLEEIVLTRGPAADHSDVSRVMAFADTDGNDLFDPEIDKQIAETKANGLEYPLNDLGLELPPDRVTYLFVAYDLNIGAEDSVVVNLLLWDADNLTIPEIPKGIDDRDSKITGEFPVDSPGEDVTDGMIAAQINLDPAPADRAAPGDTRVLAMGLTIPANGDAPDQLNYITILNSGTAAAGQDIDRIDLWIEDGGDPDHFDPADRLAATLTWNGSNWRNPVSLSETIPDGGLKCYLTFATAVTAADDRTFQAVLPIGGVDVLSGNDGPLDAAITNPNEQTISTDPLITTISTDRSSYSTGQEVVLSMRVRNEDVDTILAVTAPLPTMSGTGAATYSSGPVPGSVDLAPGADTTLVWRYTAAAAGDIQFCGFAYDGDSTEVSLETCTQIARIQDKPNDIVVDIFDVAPIAVNRGQNNVEAIALDLGYENYSAGSAPMEFGGIVLTVEDGGGAPVAPNSVLGEVTIVSSTGSNQPFVLADSVSNPLHLYLQDAILIDPGDSATLDVTMDIAPGAALAPFRLSIQAETGIVVVDANDGSPVPLATGAAFPWATSAIDVDVPADSLMVATGAAGWFFANNGQEQVEIFRFTLLNNGQPQSANEILRSIVLSFVNDNGTPIAPDDVIRKLKLSSGGAELFFTDAIPSSSEKMTCDLTSELLLPPQVAKDVAVTVDVRAFPACGGFSVSLAAPSAVVARDNNDGGFVLVAPVPPADFPVTSAKVLFQQPASGLTSTHSSLVPGDIMPSTFSVPLLDISYLHADTAASSIVVDSLAMAFVDKSGNPLFPGNYFSELFVVHAGDTLSVLTSLSSVSHLVEARLSPPVTLEPRAVESFRLYLSTKGIYTPVEFRVRIDREHVVARDANTGERISMITGAFPFYTDLARLQLPGDVVSCGLVSLVPANVTGREAGLPAFDFVVRNGSSPGHTPSVLRGVTVTAQTWQGGSIDPSSIVSGASIVFGDSVYAAASIGPSGIAFAIPDGKIVTGPGSSDTLTVTVDLAAPGEATFRFVIVDTADVDVRDAVTGDLLSARTIGNTGYPLMTQVTHTLGAGDETAFTNYPNPFAAGRQSTRITFYLAEPSRVTLKLYTLWGAPVQTLIDGEDLQPGLHQDALWEGTTGDGDVVNNGVYYLVLDIDPVAGGSTRSFKRKVGVVR